MTAAPGTAETRIDDWRRFVERGAAIASDDADELEDHLRAQIADLERAGLSADEAFLIAVRRIGDLDAVSAEYAREHGERLWKQLAVGTAPGEGDRDGAARHRVPELAVVALGAVAGVLVRIMFWLVGYDGVLASEPGALPQDLLFRNVPLCISSVLIASFAVRRRVDRNVIAVIAGCFALIVLLVNVYPFPAVDGQSGWLVAGHAVVLQWLLVGYAYVGGQWRSPQRRMDFVRFTGEFVVYLVLVALGGGLLTALSMQVFVLVGAQIPTELGTWLACLCVGGAFVVCAWLVEAKQSVIENIAPVLVRIFTPIVTIMLAALLIVVLAAGGLARVDRELLITMDVILVLVVALTLYEVSARDPRRPAGAFDALQLAMLTATILVDAVLLWAMLARIAEFGFTPNKTVALGLNVILLIHLLGHAGRALSFLRGRSRFVALERWQTGYLPVYAVWSALVVAAIPPIFGFA